VRTASSAVRPGFRVCFTNPDKKKSYNRRRTSLVSYAEFKQLSFGYDPQAASIHVWHESAPVFPELVPFFAGCRVSGLVLEALSKIGCVTNPGIKKTVGHQAAPRRCVLSIPAMPE